MTFQNKLLSSIHRCAQPKPRSAEHHINRFWIGAFFALSLSAWTPATADELSVSLSEYRGNGGRVAWSPDGEFVVFDRKGPDGGYDLYLTRDFDTERCLTCDHPDLPNAKRKYGQPAVHPNGRYIVFQAEKQKHRFIVPLATNPGAGVFNDIWLFDLETDRATPLWEVPNDKHHGTLHPQFSKDGSMLSWSELYGGIDFKHPGTLAGAWTLKVADFSPTGLSNVKEYKPGEDVIFENHGFSHDGEWLFFSSNMKRSVPLNESTDIYKIHLESEELVRLTNEGYNEHAHLSPDGKYIVWMSSVGNGNTYDFYKVGSDYWLMNADGTGKRRLTYLNDPDHPHFRGRYAVVADFDWDPAGSEEEGYRLFAYLFEVVTKNFGIPVIDKEARGEYTFMVEFKVDPPAAPEAEDSTDSSPTGGEASDPDDEFIDKRVVESHYGFYLNLAGPDLGMPDVVSHHGGDHLWCEAREQPAIDASSVFPGMENPAAQVDLYPKAPDTVTLIGITQDSAKKVRYQMRLEVENKKGNASGAFGFEGAGPYWGGDRPDVEDYGTFVIQKLDEQNRIVHSVTSNPLTWMQMKDRGDQAPKCSGSIRVEYTTQCDLAPESNVTCLARCKGTFRCENMVKTGPASIFGRYEDSADSKILPTSVTGTFDLPLLFVNEDGEFYWRGNKFKSGEAPEDLPGPHLWKGSYQGR